MRVRPRGKVAAQPRTWVGRWLLAAMLLQQAERQRLSRKLNNGKQG